MSDVSLVVEGVPDETIARRLVVYSGGTPGITFGKRGKGWIDKRIGGFTAAAQHSRWLILRDLNGASCLLELRNRSVPIIPKQMCFRLVVRALEAWIIADKESLSDAIRVSEAKIPDTPEALPNPKIVLVNLARQSRSRTIREMIVPREGSRLSVGPEYDSWLLEHVSTAWNIEKASRRSASLERAISRLKFVIDQG